MSKLSLPRLDEETVRTELSQLGLTPDNLPELTQDQCIVLFNRLFSGPKHIFVEYYGLKRSDFAQFLKGKRRSPLSTRSIQDWLRQGLILSQENLSPSELTSQLTDQDLNKRNDPLICSELNLDIIQAWLDQHAQDPIKGIILLDGISSPTVLPLLLDWPRISSYLVLVYFIRDSHHVVIDSWSKYTRDNILAITTATQVTEAILIRMAQDMVVLHFNVDTDLEFTLINPHNSGLEITTGFEGFEEFEDRTIYAINSKQDHPILALSLNELFSEQPSDRLEQLEQISTIREGVNLLKSWFGLIYSLTDLTVAILKMCPHLCPAFYGRVDLEVDELRAVVLVTLEKPGKYFQQNYQINPGNFNSFLTLRKDPLPSVELRVRRYVSTLI